MKCTFDKNIFYINGIAGLYLSLTSEDESPEIYPLDKKNNDLTILLITRDKDRLEGNKAKNHIQKFIPGGYKGLPGVIVQLIRWYCISHKISLTISMHPGAKKFWRQIFGNENCGDNFTYKFYKNEGNPTILDRLIVLKGLLIAYVMFLYYYLLSKNLHR